MDYTGTRQQPEHAHPHVLQLIMDSLRYWVTEMHVDGFRFDLASRSPASSTKSTGSRPSSTSSIRTRWSRQVKLIAEPWDVGEGGYQVGNFPPLWRSGTASTATASATSGAGTSTRWPSSATGSPAARDLYQANGRRPFASINFVTAHDGFTLPDLVSYNDKHNEANGEDNRDGTDDNRSWNCGPRAPPTTPRSRRCAQRQKRNFLATLLLSQGTPMICGGDESAAPSRATTTPTARTTRSSWYDWDMSTHDLLAFTRRLTRVPPAPPGVPAAPVVPRGRPIMGGAGRGHRSGSPPDGTTMTEDDWKVTYARSIGVFLNGGAIAALGSRGQRVVDDSFFAIFNAYEGDLEFVLPSVAYAEAWTVVIDTTPDDPDLAVVVDPPASSADGDLTPALKAGDHLTVGGRCVVVLRAARPDLGPSQPT